MSEFNATATLADRPTVELGRLRSRSVILGVVGLAAASYGFMHDRSMFFQSYLIGYMFWVGITLGSLGLLLLQYLSGGQWGLVGRRVFEAGSRNLPLMAVLFMPIALNLPTLYSWARPEALNDPVIQEKAAYLNVNGFYLRAAIYFFIWFALTAVLNGWSRDQDKHPLRLKGPMDGRMRVLAGPGMVLYFLTVTYMSVDWVMSLDPHWYSTIFGVVTIGGQGLSTLAFSILVMSALSSSKPFSQFAVPEVFHDFGKLMLAFVMLWAYFNISQLLIIWSANLPEEIPWYITRLQGFWAPIAILVLLGHFALPLLLLLSRDIKRRKNLLRWVAMFVLVMRVVDWVWTIGPVFRQDGVTLHWLDFAMVAAMGGAWLVMFSLNLGSRALVPAHDPYFQEAVVNAGH